MNQNVKLLTVCDFYTLEITAIHPEVEWTYDIQLAEISSLEARKQ